MRISFNYINITLIALILLFSACKKFEEGENFSLRSKENRLTNTWKYVSILNINSNQIQTSGFSGWSETFNKDRTYIKTINYIGSESLFNGTWEYDGSKSLIINYTIRETDISETYEIVRLSHRELCLRSDIEEKRFKID
ncbi:MAG: hypothetical protein ABIJ97_08040 [Bacteroidota bacterium]